MPGHRDVFFRGGAQRWTRRRRKRGSQLRCGLVLRRHGCWRAGDCRALCNTGIGLRYVLRFGLAACYLDSRRTGGCYALVRLRFDRRDSLRCLAGRGDGDRLAGYGSRRCLLPQLGDRCWLRVWRRRRAGGRCDLDRGADGFNEILRRFARLRTAAGRVLLREAGRQVTEHDPGEHGGAGQRAGRANFALARGRTDDGRDWPNRRRWGDRGATGGSGRRGDRSGRRRRGGRLRLRWPPPVHTEGFQNRGVKRRKFGAKVDVRQRESPFAAKRQSGIAQRAHSRHSKRASNGRAR